MDPRPSQKIDLGPIPPRTMVEYCRHLDGHPFGDTLFLEYTCIDCEFRTCSLVQMQHHQRWQRKYHTFRQRFWRWWELRMRG